jgi:hypothetical protein
VCRRVLLLLRSCLRRATPLRELLEPEPDSFERLTADERRVLMRAFNLPPRRKHRSVLNRLRHLTPRLEASERDVRAAWKVIRKLVKLEREASDRIAPQAPSYAAWRVWQEKQTPGCTFDSMAHEGSPISDYLRYSTVDSRKQEAMRMVRAVEAFLHKAPKWWLNTVRVNWQVRERLSTAPPPRPRTRRRARTRTTDAR